MQLPKERWKLPVTYYVYFVEADLKNYFVGKVNTIKGLRERADTPTPSDSLLYILTAPDGYYTDLLSEKNGIKSRASDNS
jgi:hypothetical protein